MRARSRARPRTRANVFPTTLFSPTHLANSFELERLICGQQVIDVQDWKQNTRYGGGYGAGHKTIVAFWQVVEEDLDEDERHKLLQFVTGSAHVPVGGFGCLLNKERKKTPFKVNPASTHIPSSHTCFNTLDLPTSFGDDRAKIKEVLQLLLTGEMDTGFTQG